MLIIMFVVLGITVLGAAASIALWRAHRTTAQAFLFAAAGLLFGNGLGIWAQLVSDRNTDARARSMADRIIAESKRGFDQMKEDDAATAIQGLTGTPSIAKTIVTSVLRKNIYYSDLQANIVLSRDPYTARNDTCKSLFSAVSHYDVDMYNPTDETVRYRMKIALFDIADPPKRNLDATYYESLSWVSYDESGTKRSTSTWTHDKLKNSGQIAVSDSPNTITAYPEIPIIARGHTHLSLVYHSWEFRGKGAMTLRPRMKTNNMMMKIVFPDEDFSYHVDFAHPDNGIETVCQDSLLTKTSVLARINGGILPYQGIAITWSAPASHSSAK